MGSISSYQNFAHTQRDERTCSGWPYVPLFARKRERGREIYRVRSRCSETL